ncbi:MAG: TetR/AcrR family transcriptional regulator [Pseudomonadota bacterium]
MDGAEISSEVSSQIKATRADWLNAARDVLVTAGVADVKVLTLSRQLKVSRSSFYWYFTNRQDLLDHLLAGWEARNTRTVVDRCAAPADTITQAVCNFFTCFVDPKLFDRGLDFAVREWARRDPSVRTLIDEADKTRLAAIIAMFERHGYGAEDADARARILYFMQLGYYALDVRESMSERLGRVESYLKGFTGVAPDPGEIAAFRAFAENATGEP